MPNSVKADAKTLRSNSTETVMNFLSGCVKMNAGYCGFSGSYVCSTESGHILYTHNSQLKQVVVDP